MLTLGPLGFGAPLALLGLLVLPLLWMLLRATPPAPRQLAFPPLRLLIGLQPKEETPLRTPWWVILLRMLLAAAVILGLSRPVLFHAPPTSAAGPLLLIIDDGWSSAPQWRRVQRDARALLDTAARENRDAAVLFTARRDAPQGALSPSPANDLRPLLDARRPAAWAPDHAGAAVRLAAALDGGSLPETAEPVWLSDGLDHGETAALADVLERFGPGRVRTPAPSGMPLALSPPRPDGDAVSVPVLRADGDGAREGAVLALDRDGRALARAPFRFEPGETTTLARAESPLEVRNLITHLRLEDQASAGGAQILDDGWRRPLIGLAAQSQDADRQPLLADLYYVEQALAENAETVRGRIEALLEQEPGGIVLVDASAPTAADADALEEYVRGGGLLIRFAGPRLAAESDSLVPVAVRSGGRLLGGALAWDEPQRIAPFDTTSPFFGLTPPAEATVARQVLAEPAPDLAEKTWSRLEDGTPLVTSEARGQGRIVLFHVTASPEWSDTPLSGLFVDMLGRVVAFANAGPATADAAGAGPWRLATALTATGELQTANTDVRITAEDFLNATAAYDSPPGLYERGGVRSALNIMQSDDALAPLPPLPASLRLEDAEAGAPRDLAGWLLGAGLLLLVLDSLIMAFLTGRGVRLPSRKRFAQGAAGGAASLLVAGVLFSALSAPPASALVQPDEDPSADFALRALSQFRLAYVVTGDSRIDAMSEAGLNGLSFQLARRTSVEPSAPLPVNLVSDEITLLPMLYWPISRDMPAPSAEVAAKLDAFMKGGGVLVVDTRDGAANLGQTPHPGLTRLGEALDTPPLQRTPPDHVMTRSFYLLQDFPGRWRDSPLWVEADSRGSARDGVSGLIITSADWAAAWAIDEAGRTLAALSPGGPEQREYAYRAGINLVMYILTGNYKADQVHVPAILERLGQ